MIPRSTAVDNLQRQLIASIDDCVSTYTAVHTTAQVAESYRLLAADAVFTMISAYRHYFGTDRHVTQWLATIAELLPPASRPPAPAALALWANIPARCEEP